MLLIKLFIAFFKIAFFAVGGAYSFLPLIERETVEKYNWITSSEFLDVLGITQIFPGAISIKYASYVGYKMAGIPGAIVCNLGNMLPPVITMIIATLLYRRYKNVPAVYSAFNMIRLAVFSMIIVIAFQVIGIKYLFSVKHLIFVAFFLIVFIIGKIHPAFIIIGAGLLGAVLV